MTTDPAEISRGFIHKKQVHIHQSDNRPLQPLSNAEAAALAGANSTTNINRTKALGATALTLALGTAAVGYSIDNAQPHETHQNQTITNTLPKQNQPKDQPTVQITTDKPSPLFPTTPQPPESSGNVLVDHRQEVRQEDREALLDSNAAMKRIQEYFKNPQDFMSKYPDQVIKNIESGPHGLNLRKTPGVNIDADSADSDNFDSFVEPQTPLNPMNGVAISIGADGNGEWAIMYKDDPDGIKPVYFTVANTEPIPPQDQQGQK